MIDVRAGRQDPSPWWVATICGMASFIDAIAVVAAGSALVLYQQALRLTNSQFGVMSSILQLSIAVGAVVGGRLGDTYGRRKIFSITMVAIIVAMVILVASSNWLVLCVALALAGLGIGGDLPVSLATVGEYASEENRGKLVGLSQVLWTAGLMAGAGVAAGSSMTCGSTRRAAGACAAGGGASAAGGTSAVLCKSCRWRAAR